jgi:hypothetical protein
MSEAAICLLRFPSGKIYIGSRVGDIDNYGDSYDELTAERIRGDHGGELPVAVKKILWRGANDGELLKRKAQKSVAASDLAQRKSTGKGKDKE